MSANLSTRHEPSTAPHAPIAAPSRRDFSNMLDAALMICNAIGYPLRRRANIVCALMAKAGGRAAFALDHLTLARAMQHAGSDDAARALVRRELDALEHYQRKTGRVLFNIARGGGIDPHADRRTRYEDFITPAAVKVVELARADRAAWAKNPGAAISKYITEGIKLLPQLKPEPSDAPALEPEGDETIYRRRIRRAIEAQRSAFEKIADMGNAVELRRECARQLAQELCERSGLTPQDLLEFFTPALHAEVVSGENHCDNFEAQGEPADALEVEGGGLQNCHPQELEVQQPQQNFAQEMQMVDAALLYAGDRIPIFPCKLDKTPHTPHGFKDARTDEATVRAWWRKWTDAGIGIQTGEASGWLVVDIDPKSGGDESLTRLCEDYGEGWLDTRTQQTGSGGFHFIFQYPEGSNLRNSASKIAPGIDTRGEGGYVIAAPSLHQSGRRYRITNARAPQPVPSWLIEKLKAAPKPRAVSKEERANFAGARDGARIVEGTRNETLFRIACAMRGAGGDLPRIEAELLAVNAARVSPPLPEGEVLKIVESAGRYSPNVARVG
jgi:hypothetical protein